MRPATAAILLYTKERNLTIQTIRSFHLMRLKSPHLVYLRVLTNPKSNGRYDWENWGTGTRKAGFADGIFHGEALAFSLPAITIFTFLKTIGTKMGKNVVLLAYTNGQAIA